MTRPPAVSVIVPCYNAAKTLAPCLRSVLAQTHRPHEVIVVDDASDDATMDILAGHPVRVLRLPENRGVSRARNAGAAAAQGDVLFFVDADVALRPDAVAQAVAVLSRDPAVGLVHGIYDTVPLIDDGPVEHYKILSNHFWRRRAVGRVGTALFALAAIRRSLFARTGGFDERLRDGEDIEYGNRLRSCCQIVLTDTVVGRHDDADTVTAVVREQFRRSQLLVPMALAERRAGRARPKRERAAEPPRLTGHRPAAVAATAVAGATLPAAVLVHPAALVVTALAVAGWAIAERDLYRFVRAQRGWRFLPFFLTMQMLVHVTLVCGAAVGVLRWHRPLKGTA
jgi:hypothetical protein